MNKEDILELKNMGLTQRISELVTEYENKVMDLRVEITFLSRRLQELESVSQEENTPDDED